MFFKFQPSKCIKAQKYPCQINGNSDTLTRIKALAEIQDNPEKKNTASTHNWMCFVPKSCLHISYFKEKPSYTF